MRRFNISPRTVEFLIGILATALIAAGLLIYALREPARIVQAQESQIQSDLDEAMTLYAENCSVCHGLAGEGIGATPSLDNPELRQADYDMLFKIIARGLYSTAMPAWSAEEGGSLNEYQIGELAVLIQLGDWQVVHERVVDMGMTPRIPLTTEPDPAILTTLGTLPEGDELARGVEVYAQSCVACHGADGLGSVIAPALNNPDVSSNLPGDLERTILKGVPGTLMAGWENSLAPGDIQALITLITQWDKVPEGAIPPPERPVPVTEESLALGAELYASSCSGCHGTDGQGARRAPALNVKSFLEGTVDFAMQQIISLGVPGTSMPAWSDRMTEAEIQAIVGYIRAWEPTAPEVAEPARGGGGPWWQSDARTGNDVQVGPPWRRGRGGGAYSGLN